MVLNYQTLAKIIPIIKLELFGNQYSILVKTNQIKDILLILKNHYNYQFKILTCISGVDYPDKLYRFSLVYELLSIKFNSRLRVKIITDEITPVLTVETVFSGATWWECEIWDMFGVFFLDQRNITRLLTDYGFQGYPLRKDFPLTGFVESRYSITQNRVIYEDIELAQEYRIFDYMSPWENLYKNEKINSKR